MGVGVGQKRNGERRVCDEGGVCERNRLGPNLELAFPPRVREGASANALLRGFGVGSGGFGVGVVGCNKSYRCSAREVRRPGDRVRCIAALRRG